jgi:4-hydroxy-tetrahydrodipicolinate synthase
MDNDLLAELAQIEGIEAVKQANADNLALVDGLDLYAGDDTLLLATLELGGAGGISVASHVAGDEMARLIAEPHKRRQIDESLRPLYDALAVTTNPIPIKAALELLGLPAGTLRLPLVEADEAERATVRSALERTGLLERAGT